MLCFCFLLCDVVLCSRDADIQGSLLGKQAPPVREAVLPTPLYLHGTARGMALHLRGSVLATNVVLTATASRDCASFGGNVSAAAPIGACRRRARIWL